MSDEQVSAYRQQIEAWRKDRERALAAPDGWLSLTGLFILQEGEQRVGSGADNEIVLPQSAPAHLGTIVLAHGKVGLTVTTETPVCVDGAPVEHVELVDNSNGRHPTVVKVGDVSFFVHKFSNDLAIRVKDRNHPAIQAFTGCKWFEIDPAYRVEGQLVREGSPAAIPVKTSVQTEAEYQSIGAVEFMLQGQSLRLLASATRKREELFIIFRDGTAGRQSYGAGRYLYANVDEADKVVLDFNKAYNPPCAFTPYATCSLPPRANVLSFSIEAGERYERSFGVDKDEDKRAAL
ncbi:MAG: DUF1684 domain-containing protein [Caldilineaceae bacterium]|nr:DUF1684 domain-containing protein [Caldilineaceae bacterium]